MNKERATLAPLAQDRYQITCPHRSEMGVRAQGAHTNLSKQGPQWLWETRPPLFAVDFEGTLSTQEKRKRGATGVWDVVQAGLPVPCVRASVSFCGQARQPSRSIHSPKILQGYDEQYKHRQNLRAKSGASHLRKSNKEHMHYHTYHTYLLKFREVHLQKGSNAYR